MINWYHWEEKKVILVIEKKELENIHSFISANKKEAVKNLTVKVRLPLQLAHRARLHFHRSSAVLCFPNFNTGEGRMGERSEGK